MRIPEQITADIRRRLARIEGQLRGIQRMLDEPRECRDVVSQMRAAERALERARLRLLASGMRYCAEDPARSMQLDELEDLLLRSS
jgi:DNA-binding FrmR family transcriptional regulator